MVANFRLRGLKFSRWISCGVDCHAIQLKLNWVALREVKRPAGCEAFQREGIISRIASIGTPLHQIGISNLHLTFNSRYRLASASCGPRVAHAYIGVLKIRLALNNFCKGWQVIIMFLGYTELLSIVKVKRFAFVNLLFLLMKLTVFLTAWFMFRVQLFELLEIIEVEPLWQVFNLQSCWGEFNWFQIEGVITSMAFRWTQHMVMSINSLTLMLWFEDNSSFLVNFRGSRCTGFGDTTLLGFFWTLSPFLVSWVILREGWGPFISAIRSISLFHLAVARVKICLIIFSKNICHWVLSAATLRNGLFGYFSSCEPT